MYFKIKKLLLFSQIPSLLFVSYGGKVHHSTYFIKFNRLIIRAKLMWGPHMNIYLKLPL